jgi:hypothetical protein
MRIRYAYKLEDAEGNTSYAVLNHVKSPEEVQEQFKDKGIVKVEFHERVRTGFRLNENGELVPTGLSKAVPADAPAAPAASAEAPTKKAKKAKK